MTNIRSVILKYLWITAAVMVVLVVFIAMTVQVFYEQKITRSTTEELFAQVKQLMEENSKEFEETKDAYSKTCLNNAGTIAYMIQSDPAILEDHNKLLRVAGLVGVDEINLFNEEGVIFNGTHPQYYNMSVNDGEQIGFFKQMLNNKSAKLVQDLRPNTAVGALMQYSAVWCTSGDFFVQVGMRQENVQKVTAKNELSYIFAQLRVNSEVDLYAVDMSTNKVVAASDPEQNGKVLSALGIPVIKVISKDSGFHAVVNDKLSFCIFEEYDGKYIGRVVTVNEMYRNVGSVIMALACGALGLAVLLVVTITRFINKEIIVGIRNVNGKLAEITSGNLDARVSVRSCVEFSELSDHINQMIATVLASTDKISYILDKADLQIGVYEFNEKMKTVRITEKVFKILSAGDWEINLLSNDSELFKDYIKARIFDCVEEEENIYRLYGETEHYIKFEEFYYNNSMLGILMDVTEDYKRRRQLEIERDIDALTGLLNRSGLERRLGALFKQPEQLGYGALVMIDADGLKSINDNLGHEAGDAYLKSIGDTLKTFGSRNSICARQGGDEYVLFLYKLESAAQVAQQIQRLEEIQKTVTAKVTKNKTVPIRFSFGVSLLDGSGDYAALLKAADDKMYISKRERKERLGIPGRT